MNKIFVKIALSILLLPLAAASQAQSILSLKYSITDSTIVYPESFETDTHKMMQNWYLQNYAVLNNNFLGTAMGSESDEVYIKRLAAIPTTIELPYNQIVRSYINMYTERRRQLVENMLGMSLYYMPIFEQALERKGLPLELRFLPVIESALNPEAVSRTGATGLWQFMLPTARGLGLEINTLVDERRDPYASSEAAATYLKQLHAMYNDWSLAIAAYNCGPGNVNKALRRAGGKDCDFWSIYYFLPKETRGYVPAFIAANYVMTYYNQHGISPALARRPIVTDSVHVTDRVHFQQISDVLNIPVEELRVLNPQYRHDVIPGDSHPYSLVLPSMQVYSYVMSRDSIVAHNRSLYERRATVEPSTSTDGEYTTKLVVKKHKVKRGETFSSIAKLYGVTINELKSWNGISRKTKNLQQGKVLKINTYERVPVVKPEAKIDEAPDSILEGQRAAQEAADSLDVAMPGESVPVDSVAVEAGTEAAPAPESAPEAQASAEPEVKTPDKAFSQTKPDKNVSAKPAQKPAKSSSATVTYTVKKGDSLFRISKKYGVSVAQIQEANNIKGNDIKVGQKLKIPAK